MVSCPRQGKLAPSGDERGSSPSAEGWFCGFKTIQPPCRLGNSTHPRNFKKQKFPTFSSRSKVKTGLWPSSPIPRKNSTHQKMVSGVFPISYIISLSEVVSDGCGPGVALYAGAVLVLVGDSVGEVSFGCLYAKSAIPAACVGDVEGVACTAQAYFVSAVAVAECPYVACFCHRADGPGAVLDVCAVAETEREHPDVSIIAVMTDADTVGVGIRAKVCVAEACERGQSAHAKADASFGSDADAVCITVSGTSDGAAAVMLLEVVASMEVGDVAEVCHQSLFDSAIESKAVVVDVVLGVRCFGISREASIHVRQGCADCRISLLVEVTADDNAIELCIIGSAHIGQAETADIFLGVDEMSPEILILIFCVKAGQVGCERAVEEVVCRIESMLVRRQVQSGLMRC